MRTDNPVLDLDDTENTGPENINIESPSSDVFYVDVHDFGNSSVSTVFRGDNDVTVKVYVRGLLVYDVTKVMSGQDKWKDFAKIDWTVSPPVVTAQ